MHLPDALVRTIDRVTQRLYVASGGRVGHRQGPWRMLLLTTTGRRSGEPRTHALLYLPHGDDLLVVASNNGADASPAWYLNLRAHPDVVVRRGRGTGPFRARTATGAERATLWPLLTRHNPAYLGHQARTQRTIPVVVLTAAGPRRRSSPEGALHPRAGGRERFGATGRPASPGGPGGRPSRPVPGPPVDARSTSRLSRWGGQGRWRVVR